mmetsp:Transcript_22991/g.22838  ORF Transcript_22991/g.22838 Transcript_22991/m.22838 type:complete len:129 (+) Transcript_22991:738-1124(+)|eukprot:CAMPEP_0196999442 /NCGR_PEP_ID=MMETSP1380-20130617/4616_1 /TAXON_ID=5936 /ORGANISM="Euplotes crassus, Strain CT5" /LENGTH=128 /DNA_ID=CAMNT_0042416371 /DNA_START=427 /DNA_END=813 /DNA_ORIENTATION=+
MDEQGDALEFINQKLKKTLDISMFHQDRSSDCELAKIKKLIDKSFDDIYDKLGGDIMHPGDSRKFENTILSNFVIKIKKDKVEEDKEADPEVFFKNSETIPLATFLRNERELAKNLEDNDRSTKVYIS